MCNRRNRFQSTPLMRGETCNNANTRTVQRFQSTPLMRGETETARGYIGTPYISIHSPHARGDGNVQHHLLPNMISIHSPHARGDASRRGCLKIRINFNPLPSCEGRRRRLSRSRRAISIHSPHARGDRVGSCSFGVVGDFNPLPSCEGRQHKPLKIRLDSRQFIQQKHHSSFF